MFLTEMDESGKIKIKKYVITFSIRICVQRRGYMKKSSYFTPVVTAFDRKGRLDVQGNRNIWDHLIGGGVSGLVIMGSIGEFFAMTGDEKRQMIDEAASWVGGRTKLYIGTGCMTVEETVELSNYALSRGVDGVMVISPYYFSLSEESIEYYYDEVASKVKGDLFLYNFPERTGYDLTPEITLKLLRKHKNIKGYKDTLGVMAHTRKLIRTVSEEFPDFIVLSGFDEFFVHNVLCGGNGCIGGLSNIYPELFARWMKALDDGDMKCASEIQRIVDRAMAIYDVAHAFVPIIKTAVKMRGVEMEDGCKKPFISPGEKEQRQIRDIMDAVEQMIEALG